MVTRGRSVEPEERVKGWESGRPLHQLEMTHLRLRVLVVHTSKDLEEGESESGTERKEEGR